MVKRVRLQWMGPWRKRILYIYIYLNVSWLVDYLYVCFAKIFPAEKILYAKKCQYIGLHQGPIHCSRTVLLSGWTTVAEFVWHAT